MKLTTISVRDIGHAGKRRAVDAAQVANLAASIDEIGLLSPIVVRSAAPGETVLDPDTGETGIMYALVSGAHRLAAFRHLGRGLIPAFLSDLDGLRARLAELDENLFRNDLSVLERSEALAERKEVYEALYPETKHGAQGGGRDGLGTRTKTENGTMPFSVDAASKLGESRTTIERDVKIARDLAPDVKEQLHGSPLEDRKVDLLNLSRLTPDQQRELLAPIRDGTAVTLDEAKKQLRARARDEARNRRLAERSEAQVYTSPFVKHGDARDLAAELEDNSIDFIFTDPPYPEEFLPLFSDLSEIAARVLKPGGICMTYSGLIFLPEVMARLGSHLEYVWTCAIRHTGGLQRVFKPNVNTAWKPLLWYVKPPREVYWDSFIDMTSGGREKDLHTWQQAEAEAAYFIEKLSPPGGTVFDPFCGSGTTLVAARRLGRVPLGFDIDPDAVEKSRRRLDDETT